MVAALCVVGFAVVAAGVGLVLVARPSTPATPQAKTSAAAAIPTSFATAADLVAALNANGLPCGTAKTVDNPIVATSMIDCGPNVVVAVYKNHTDAAGQFDRMMTLLDGTGMTVRVVVGTNWTVSGEDRDYLQSVAAKFGADYNTGTTASRSSPTPPAAPATPAVPQIQDGTWTVGEDIPAGTYKVTGAPSNCYWGIYKSGTNQDQIINNHIGGGNLRVTLKVGQDFETKRCGTWVKV